MKKIINGLGYVEDADTHWNHEWRQKEGTDKFDWLRNPSK